MGDVLDGQTARWLDISNVCYGARTRPWCSISLLEVSLKFDNGIEGDIIRDDVSFVKESKREC